MGPSVAQDMVETFLPYKAGGENYVTEDIHFIESRLEDYHSRLTGLAAELDALRRYHRQTLQELPMGVCSLAKDQEILMWNKAMEELTGIAAQRVVGSRLSTIGDPWKPAARLHQPARRALAQAAPGPRRPDPLAQPAQGGDRRTAGAGQQRPGAAGGRPDRNPDARRQTGALRAPGQHRSPGGRRGP
jgi:PAS domain-containing protein